MTDTWRISVSIMSTNDTAKEIISPFRSSELFDYLFGCWTSSFRIRIEHPKHTMGTQNTVQQHNHRPTVCSLLSGEPFVFGNSDNPSMHTLRNTSNWKVTVWMVVTYGGGSHGRPTFMHTLMMDQKGQSAAGSRCRPLYYVCCDETCRIHLFECREQTWPPDPLMRKCGSTAHHQLTFYTSSKAVFDKLSAQHVFYNRLRALIFERQTSNGKCVYRA